MLTYDEKYILRKIAKLSKNKTHFDSRKELYNLVAKKYTIRDLDLILDSLYEKDFFESEHYNKYINGGRGFIVKQNTKKYNEIALKKIIFFIINSIAVPVVVSIITTLITALITFSDK